MIKHIWFILWISIRHISRTSEIFHLMSFQYPYHCIHPKDTVDWLIHPSFLLLKYWNWRSRETFPLKNIFPFIDIRFWIIWISRKRSWISRNCPMEKILRWHVMRNHQTSVTDKSFPIGWISTGYLSGNTNRKLHCFNLLYQGHVQSWFCYI